MSSDMGRPFLPLFFRRPGRNLSGGPWDVAENLLSATASATSWARYHGSRRAPFSSPSRSMMRASFCSALILALPSSNGVMVAPRYCSACRCSAASIIITSFACVSGFLLLPGFAVAFLPKIKVRSAIWANSVHHLGRPSFSVVLQTSAWTA